MNTALLLMAQYNAQAIIPLEKVCADYFSHLTPARMRTKVAAGEIDLPLIRIEDSQKVASGVHLMDLAAYLENQRSKAKLEVDQSVLKSLEKSVVTPPKEESTDSSRCRESSLDLIKMPEVRKLTGCCNSSIYKMISAGDFPRQVKLGARAVAWIRGEILEWIQGRVHAARSDRSN